MRFLLDFHVVFVLKFVALSVKKKKKNCGWFFFLAMYKTIYLSGYELGFGLESSSGVFSNV